MVPATTPGRLDVEKAIRAKQIRQFQQANTTANPYAGLTSWSSSAQPAIYTSAASVLNRAGTAA